ncbi:MAG TPA: M1 family aminopeptidase, partial [Candidatus Bathyarchaeia archaeon]|nr:M1 family aminopeptidase [Candidatus Bathyarchaeia archaeon]
VVIHSGYEKGKTEQGAETIYHLATDFPVRAFSFSMSPDYQVVRSSYGETTLQCFFLPGDEARAKQAVENLKGVFAFYEKTFGPYPYKQFSVAPVHLGYGGEQMANMILIDTRVFKLPRLLDREFDLLIAHEAGHQWLYNMIGADGNKELWLEEGLNSYFVLQYISEKYGPDANVLEYPPWFEPYAWMLPEATFSRLRDYRYQLEARTGYDQALIGPLEDFKDPSRIFSLVYGKGVDTVAAIRGRIGHEAFTNVFKKAYARYRFGNWSVEDLMRLCAEESGQDLKEFFQQRLYSDGQCDYAAFGRGNGILLKRLGAITEPVEAEVVLADETTARVAWDGKGESFQKEFSQKVKRVAVDPDQKVFDIDRTNNVWPRIWNLKPVPLYFGLYDNPLFVPDDRYNVVVGPEINDGIGVKVSVQRPYEHILYGATDYEMNDQLWSSRAGFLKKNMLRSPISFGAEVANVEDQDGGEEDLLSGKVYLRKDFESWPYGMFDLQDHATLYVIRNQRPNGRNETFSNTEDDRNFEYRRRDEAIVGVSYALNRSAPYPDPKQGVRLNTNAETAGHMLGGQEAFYRSAIDLTGYVPVTAQTKLATRAKVGLGYPDDKDLFQLGGLDGLRGYGRKTIRGANTLLGVCEYRFPLVPDLNWYALDHIFGLRKIDGGVFFEAGQSWFSSFDEAEWKTDAGLSLRFHVDIGGFLEKVIVRLDAAQAINDSGEEPRFWLSVSQPF